MAITPLPTITVLVRSTPRLSVDGYGVLYTERTEYTGLHVVTKDEAFRQIEKWKTSQPRDWQLVVGAALMRHSLWGENGEKDWSAFQNAVDDVERWIPRIFADEIQMLRESKNWKKAGWAYSALMSNVLRTAHFVFWQSTKDHQPRPGLVCPNWEAAVHAVATMDIRICKKPGCGVPFIPRLDTQKYCVPAHGNADRVARCKANKERSRT